MVHCHRAGLRKYASGLDSTSDHAALLPVQLGEKKTTKWPERNRSKKALRTLSAAGYAMIYIRIEANQHY